MKIIKLKNENEKIIIIDGIVETESDYYTFVNKHNNYRILKGQSYLLIPTLKNNSYDKIEMNFCNLEDFVLLFRKLKIGGIIIGYDIPNEFLNYFNDNIKIKNDILLI